MEPLEPTNSSHGNLHQFKFIYIVCDNLNCSLGLYGNLELDPQASTSCRKKFPLYQEDTLSRSRPIWQNPPVDSQLGKKRRKVDRTEMKDRKQRTETEL